MKTRQLVFNNEENAKFASENFACVSTSDVAYKFLPDEMKEKNEFKLLRRALSDAPNGIHQGIYVITPRGKLLGKIDQGWPTYDTAAALKNMKNAQARYQAMDKDERLAPRDFRESDRSYHRAGYGKAREGTIQLMSITRGLPFADMELFDLRHPSYFMIDRLWYTEEELRSLIPGDPSIGVETIPNKEVMARLVKYGHFHLGGLPWWDEHVQTASLKSKVVAMKEGKVFLTLEGEIKTDADSQYNSTKYDGKVLGRIIYRLKDQRFEKFELVGLGTHDLRKLASNVHRGKTTLSQVAFFVTLNDQGDSEKEITPAGIQNYPRHLKPVAYRDIKW